MVLIKNLFPIRLEGERLRGIGDKNLLKRAKKNKRINMLFFNVTEIVET
jgi:hypothetical protein